MSRISVYMLGSALACVLAFTTPASAQLVPNLGLPGVTEALAPVVEAVAPVVETVLGPQAPLADVVYVSTNDGNPSVTVLGGESPISLDTGSSLGVDLPVVTINLPDTASLPDLPVELPGLPQLPDITNNNPGGGDIINNYPPGDPGTVIIIGDNDNPALPGGVTTNSSTRSNSIFGNSNNRGSANQGITGRNGKLAFLLAILQNRGWMNFVAGRGICLPPFAVTQVRDMLSRREERQLDGVLASFANDIATMRSLMANCRNGTRLTAGDINRIVGVGISRNGTPMLYLL